MNNHKVLASFDFGGDRVELIYRRTIRKYMNFNKSPIYIYTYVYIDTVLVKKTPPYLNDR